MKPRWQSIHRKRETVAKYPPEQRGGKASAIDDAAKYPQVWGPNTHSAASARGAGEPEATLVAKSLASTS